MMYYCKITSTEQEFTDIAKLNYATFVEEIPQHPANDQKQLIDKFHEQNTYLVFYHQQELIAMLAFRDQRPFSLDGKIGAVEDHLDEATCKKLCEIRLLAIKPNYRRSFVFLRLAQALYAYVVDKHYSACVISGTTLQQKLYQRIGFKAFAPAVGTPEASFLPMVLTANEAHDFHAPFQAKNHVFYPGPVAQNTLLKHTSLSHRSASFQHLHQQLSQSLLQLSQAKHVALLHGSGTLANEVMLQQLKALHGEQPGLICSNGEFGERLIRQAQDLGLNFKAYQENWGTPFNAETLLQQSNACHWLLAAHGETSSGCLNDLSALVKCKQHHHLTLALDCISSFGAVPFSLSDVDLASATSGKAIGALAGLSMVFYQHDAIKLERHGAYCQLARYHQSLPFTLPAYLVSNVLSALQAYPERYQTLKQHLQDALSHPILQQYCVHTQHYPTAISYQLPPEYAQNAALNGLFLHHHSAYLQQKQWAQISTIQPSFADDFATLNQWLKHLEHSNQLTTHA